jgi:hypothetical protein
MKAPTVPVTPAKVRPAEDRDVAAITEIYAHHVRHGVASFEETSPDQAEIRRCQGAIREQGLPYLIAEIDGAVAGFAYTAPARPTAIRSKTRSICRTDFRAAASARGCSGRSSSILPTRDCAR